MAYAALSAFIDNDKREINPEEDAERFSEKWSGLSREDLQAELLPVFQRLRDYIEFVGIHPKDVLCQAKLSAEGETVSAPQEPPQSGSGEDG